MRCHWQDCPREGTRLLTLREAWLCEEHFREALNLVADFQSEFSNAWRAYWDHLALAKGIPLPPSPLTDEQTAELMLEMQFFDKARTQIQKMDSAFKEIGRERTVAAIVTEVARLLSDEGEATAELETRILPIVVQYFADHGYNEEASAIG